MFTSWMVSTFGVSGSPLALWKLVSARAYYRSSIPSTEATEPTTLSARSCWVRRPSVVRYQITGIPYLR